MKRSYDPDPRPTPQVRDKQVLKAVHAQGCWCIIPDCGLKAQAHHVYSRGQRGDDVLANLICLCDSHHGLYHDHQDVCVRQQIGEHILLERPDTVLYLQKKLGVERWAGWMSVRLLVT